MPGLFLKWNFWISKYSLQKKEIIMKKRILPILIALLISPFFLTGEESSDLTEGIYARLSTPRGDLIYQLDYRNLPLTVSNFVAQAEGNAESALNDNLSFSRVVKGYALFSGASPVSGQGGEEYTFPREQTGSFSSSEPGALMMESRKNEDSGSRFLILIQGDSFLDSKYTVFGKLIRGAEILPKIKQDDDLSIEIMRIGSDAQSFRPDEEAVASLISAAREKNRQLFAEENPRVAAILDQLGEDLQVSETGIYYKVFRKGSGAKPRPGNTVQMHYSGKLVTGQEFDNSYMRGEPFSFTLGEDGVIPGWVETALSMQPGEQRTVVLPPELAYGERGYGPIPPDSWLIFDIELIDFQ